MVDDHFDVIKDFLILVQDPRHLNISLQAGTIQLDFTV